MQDKPNDILLAAGQVLTVLLMGLTIAVAMLLVGIIPFLLLNYSDFAQAVTEAGGSNITLTLGAAIVTLLTAAALCAIAFYFFKLLRQLILSVGKDDPFTLENASRLDRMGWIALIFQIATFPIAALVAYLGHLVPAENLTVDFQFSLTGVLLAVVLFILARVFKHGATMREDLEGTV